MKALAHPVRLQILDLLRRNEECVCHMEAVIGKRQAYISQQLMTLREIGLVESRKDGLQVFYRLVDDSIVSVLDAVLGPVPDAAIGSWTVARARNVLLKILYHAVSEETNRSC